MVAGFRAVEDVSTAHRVADNLRSRIAKQSNKREVQVVDDYDVDKAMLSAGFNYTPGQ